MITAKNLKANLEEVMTMIKSNYTIAQWDIKSEIDTARYLKAKNVYEESRIAIDCEDIDWEDITDEEYEEIGQLMEHLELEIEMMEEDLCIE